MNQVRLKNLKTGKEMLLAEAGAKNLLAMYPKDWEKVESEKPKATGFEEDKPKRKRKKKESND